MSYHFESCALHVGSADVVLEVDEFGAIGAEDGRADRLVVTSDHRFKIGEKKVGLCLVFVN